MGTFFLHILFGWILTFANVKSDNVSRPDFWAVSDDVEGRLKEPDDTTHQRHLGEPVWVLGLTGGGMHRVCVDVTIRV